MDKVAKVKSRRYLKARLVLSSVDDTSLKLMTRCEGVQVKSPEIGLAHTWGRVIWDNSTVSQFSPGKKG